jgi:hypothetical protein
MTRHIFYQKDGGPIFKIILARAGIMISVPFPIQGDCLLHTQNLLQRTGVFCTGANNQSGIGGSVV